MENVEIKEVVKKPVVKKEKKAKKAKKDNSKVAFMEHSNVRRERAGLPMAYTKEEIEAYR
jgi:hypothetical protein